MEKSNLYIEAYKNCIAIKQHTGLWISRADTRSMEEGLQCICAFFQAESIVSSELENALKQVIELCKGIPGVELAQVKEKANIFF